MTYNTYLEARVAARNRVNNLAAKMLPQITEVFKAFVGQKVVNVTGVLTDKVKHRLPTTTGFESYPEITQIFYRSNGYSITAMFKVSETYIGRHPGDTMATYAEYSATVADLDRENPQHLKSVITEFEIKTDYTVDYVNKARAELREAQRVLSEKRSKLYDFGECDNG